MSLLTVVMPNTATSQHNVDEMAAEFDFPLKTTVDVSALDAMLKDKAKYAKLVTIFKFEYLYCHALLMVFFNYIFRDHTWPVLAALALALSAES